MEAISRMRLVNDHQPRTGLGRVLASLISNMQFPC